MALDKATKEAIREAVKEGVQAALRKDLDEAIKPATRKRINRQARIIAEDMVDEEDFVNLIRMSGALAVLGMAMVSDTDQEANLLVDKARKLRTKKS